MAGDDDIARSLPRPPLPAPARREAAIGAALRRFDGEAEPERLAARATPWGRGPARPYAGALAGAFLVALIALPVAWNSMPDVAERKAGDSRPAAVPEAPPPGPALAEAVPEPTPAAPSAGADRDEAPTAELRAGAARAESDVAEGPAPVVAPPPPPPEPAADSLAELADARQVAPAEPAPESPLVVTGSRIRNPAQAAPAPLESGKSQRAARGREERAGAPVADGFSRARNDELDSLDRAIEAAPRSSAAWLNRGLAWRRRGDLDRALADLDRAVRYAPRSAAAYRARSLVLRERGNLKRARADEARAEALERREAEGRR